MKILTVNINDLIIEGSRFNAGAFIYKRTQNGILEKSIEESGLLNPVIVYEDRNNRYHLVDGWKRIAYARTKRIKDIEAVVLPAVSSPEDIIRLIYCDKVGEINGSMMNKMEFVCFALHLDAGKGWITECLCIPLGLKPHRSFLEECMRIHRLPEELKLFSHEKRLSLKQIVNLSYYPAEIINQVLQWKSSIHLTASVLDEIASRLRDYLKVSEKKMRDFLHEPDVKEVFDASLDIRERTEKLRTLLRQKRYPLLTEVNSRIQEHIDGLNLPRDICIHWDRSLENKGVDIAMHITDPLRWSDMMNSLTSDTMGERIKKILDEL